MLVDRVVLEYQGKAYTLPVLLVGSAQSKLEHRGLADLHRFCADFIEKKLKLSPVGILVSCAILACIGLNLLSGIATFAGALVALAVYAIGKTFFWPTTLGVVSEQFPKGRAHTNSAIAGVGMI